MTDPMTTALVTTETLPSADQMNAAMEWIFRDLGGPPAQPARPVQVRMVGGILDEKRVTVDHFPAEMRYAYEVDHEMLDVKVRRCDVYYPSFFAPLTYVLAGTFKR